jgi:hypothetical protein
MVNLLKKYIDEFKCGKLWLKASFRILTPDLIMLAEHIGGLKPKGCLENGKFYSKNIESICNGEHLIERNPHLCASEHVILEGTDNELLQKYCGHLANIVMINGYDVIDARLNGSDKDGDLSIVVDNSIMKMGVDRNRPFVIDIEDKATAKADKFVLENKIKSIILSMDNRIGEYSNVATGYHNKSPKSLEQKKKYEGFIDLVSILNAKEIDYAKCGVRFNLPRYIAKYAKPLPYFMKYAGKYYRELKKFNKSQSNMNRLCWFIEKWSKEIRFKRKYRDFDYNIMIDDTIPWDEEKFSKIEELYLQYHNEIKELQKQNAMNQNSENYENYYGDMSKEEIINTNINWQYYYDKYAKMAKIICPNKNELANYAVKLCYEKYNTRNKKFIWVIAGQGVVSNLKQENILLPIENDEGIEYLGKKYVLTEVSNIVV